MYSPSDPDEKENLRIYIIANMPLSPLIMFFIVVKRSLARTIKWAKTEKCIPYPTRRNRENQRTKLKPKCHFRFAMVPRGHGVHGVIYSKHSGYIIVNILGGFPYPPDPPPRVPKAPQNIQPRATYGHPVVQFQT